MQQAELVSKLQTLQSLDGGLEVFKGETLLAPNIKSMKQTPVYSSPLTVLMFSDIKKAIIRPLPFFFCFYPH